MRLTTITFRGILNSCGKTSLEAEVTAGSIMCRASVPQAITRGYREKAGTPALVLGNSRYKEKHHLLLDRLTSFDFASQDAFDDEVADYNSLYEVGSDVTLALSLAFAKVMAAYEGKSICEYISALSHGNMSMPYPLINIFSGGIHDPQGSNMFQQIMVLPKYNSIDENINAAIKIYDHIEAIVKHKKNFKGYSSASGLMLDEDHEILIRIVKDSLDELGIVKANIAIDAAAEHLSNRGNGEYRWRNQRFTTADLVDMHITLTGKFGLKYIEDPLHPEDREGWISLMSKIGPEVMISGDDLFATNSQYIDSRLANTVVLKMTQNGSLSSTIKTALLCQQQNMTLCVSHRSCETEDVVMCDLAVGLGTRLIKIGGPRRGDRTAQFNQLLRLSPYQQKIEKFARVVTEK